MFKQVRWFHLLLIGLMVSLLLGAAGPTAAAGNSIQERYHGRLYTVYVPGGYTPGTAVPLVVMLHGCTQTARSFANATKMNSFAEAQTFIAMYPQQSLRANPSRCWNWFDPVSQVRGSGEPAEIIGMIDQVKAAYTIDAGRVYVAGFSSGAAMTVILGATYPDVFAGIAVHSGLEYKAGTDLISATMAMLFGGPDPNQQGTAAYAAMGPFARRVPAIVFHGTQDFSVNPINGDQVLTQWAQTNDWAGDGVDNNDVDDSPESTTPGQVPGGRTYTVYTYEDQNSNLLLEKVLVDGMGHYWSGGQPGGSFTDPNGPDASALILNFWMDSAQ